MRFERPTCCICRGTFCIQISCSNNSTISPTESLSTFCHITPFLSILIPTLQHLPSISWACSMSFRHTQTHSHSLVQLILTSDTIDFLFWVCGGRLMVDFPYGCVMLITSLPEELRTCNLIVIREISIHQWALQGCPPPECISPPYQHESSSCQVCDKICTTH